MRDARQDALEAYEAHMDQKEATTTRTNWEHKQRAADFDRSHAPEIPNPEEATAREARASRGAENIGRANPRGSMAHAGANLRRRAPESGPAPTPVRQSARNAREDGPAPAAAQGLGATRVNWTTRENMPAPESAAEHAHMTRHIRTELAEAEEALEKMPARSTRASKQLEDKITWLKTQTRLLVLEIGVGFQTPTVCRFPAEAIARQIPGSRFVRVSASAMDAQVPPDLRDEGRALSLVGTAENVLCALVRDVALEESEEGSDEELVDFAPATVPWTDWLRRLRDPPMRFNA